MLAPLKLDRREVMAAAAGAALIAPAAARAGTAKPARSPDVVFYDPRYDDSVAFAAGMARAGAVTRSVTEDHGEFLRGPVAEAFAKAKAPRLSGVTLHTDFFVVSAIARELGGRVVHEARHDGRGAALEHTITKGAATVQSLDAAQAGWAQALAESLTPDARRAAADTPSQANVALFSWSIQKV